MVTGTKQTNEKLKVKRYKIQHSIDECNLRLSCDKKQLAEAKSKKKK